MSFFAILISFGYALTLLCLAMPALRYVPSTLSRKRENHRHHFTVIIVYRNEISALPNLLESLKDQIYDSEFFEILMVNDGSTDGSQESIKRFARENPTLNLQLLNRESHSNSAKKDGITQAIHLASHEHILLTDADCTLPDTWIASYAIHYQKYKNALLVAGPVTLSGTGFIPTLQQLEMIALQTITCGAFAMRQPFMCNGANLSFTKTAFELVDGYHGNDHLSSGDDIFLLEKLAAEDVLQCHYLKDAEAIVQTSSKSRWREMIVQRARWARKGKYSKSLLNKLVAFQVAAMSLLILISPILWWSEWLPLRILVAVYFLKFFSDFVVLVIGNQFLPHKNWVYYFLPQFIIYPIAVLWIGVRSLGQIEWKGRTIDQ